MSVLASSLRLVERRRLLAVLLVATMLALAGVANATLRPSGPTAGGVASGISPIVAVDSASSAAWYCPGPLPIGAGNDASSIAVTNVSDRLIAGELDVATTVSGSTVHSLHVDAGSESVFGLTRQGPRGSAAATVLVDGSGVAVEELIHGSHGVSATPCSDRTSALEYLAAGSTLGASNLSLALFDPGGTPAIVSVAFATNDGPISPPAFQGLTVGAGSVTVLDVGHYVPERAVVSTMITATGGHIAAGAVLTAVVANKLISAAATAVPTTSASWLLPAAPAGSATTSTFNVLNPGTKPAKVTLTLSDSTTTTQLVSVVPAHSVVALTPGSEDAAGALRCAVLTSKGEQVVVDRETILTSKVIGSAEQTLITNAARAAKAAAKAKAAAAKAAKAAKKAKSKAEAAARIVAATIANHEAAAARARAEKAAAATRAARALAKKEHRRYVAPTTTTSTTTTLAPTTTTSSTTLPATTTTVPFANISALPELQPGITVTSGVAAGAKEWVISGGESDVNTSEVVVIDNLGKSAATVHLNELTGTGSLAGAGVSLPSLSAVDVPASAIVTLNVAPILPRVADLPLVVSSSTAIVVGELLYSRNAPGEALVSAVPVS